MMLFLLFLNFLCGAVDNAVDDDTHINNFFLHCLERKSQFEQLPAEPAHHMHDNNYFNQLNICSMFIKSAFDDCNQTRNIDKLSIQFLNSSLYSMLLKPDNKKLANELFESNKDYISKIKPRLIKEWNFLKESERNYFIVIMHKSYNDHKKAYAQFLGDDKVSHHGIKSLKRFAKYYLILEIFGSLGMNQKLIAPDGTQHCPLQ
jgi:hypothetical protein